eukprot:252458_1
MGACVSSLPKETNINQQQLKNKSNRIIKSLPPKQNTPLIISYPDLDPIKYASNYTSPIKLRRLLHIASIVQTTNIKLHCYKIATDESRKRIDIGIYDRAMEEKQSTYNKLNKIDECKFDAVWMNEQSNQNDQRVKYLENEVVKSKNKRYREMIFDSYVQLAESHVQMGNFYTAMANYIYAKSYAGCSSELLDMNLKIMTMYVITEDYRNFMHEAQWALTSEELLKDKTRKSKIFACYGLYEIHRKRYDMAAFLFYRL